MSEKNIHAVELSKLGASKGGTNAAKNLGKQGRIRRASRAAKARWRNVRKMDPRNIRRRQQYAEKKRQEREAAKEAPKVEEDHRKGD